VRGPAKMELIVGDNRRFVDESCPGWFVPNLFVLSWTEKEALILSTQAHNA